MSNEIIKLMRSGILLFIVFLIWGTIGSVDNDFEKYQKQKENIHMLLGNGDTIMYKITIKTDTTYYLQNAKRVKPEFKLNHK